MGRFLTLALLSSGQMVSISVSAVMDEEREVFENRKKASNLMS
jgi:hypothetical protein